MEMLSSYISAKNIKMDMESSEKDEAFEELVELALSVQPGIGRQDALDALAAREATMSTGIIPGIAVPHAMCQSVKDIAVVIGVSRDGIEYDALDGQPVHFVVMLLFETGHTEAHLSVMKDVAALLQRKDFYHTAMAQNTAQGLCDAIRALEENGDND